MEDRLSGDDTYSRNLLRCSLLYAHSVSPQQDICSQSRKPKNGS